MIIFLLKVGMYFYPLKYLGFVVGQPPLREEQDEITVEINTIINNIAANFFILNIFII